MTMTIKNIYKSLYNLRNILLFQATTSAELKKFMTRVRPHTTNHSLVRIGGSSDGGYLLPDDFSGVEICFSPGVADSSRFELAMAEKDIRSFMADYSVDGPAQQSEFFHFEKKFLGTENNDVYTTLESWVNRHAQNKTDLILQMDIENSEYAVIENTPRSILKKFRILTIEFHRMGNLRNTKQLKKISRVFEKILLDFEVVHIHPNNAASVVSYRGLQIPRLLEITFLRKDRISHSSPTLAFPHELDKANVNNRPDRPLPQCWYRF
jgi:hypothetical protein